MNWKKTAACMLTLSVASVSAALAVDAKPSSMQVTLNGTAIGLSGYEIEGSNYFKLRDLAYALRGTASNFAVDFDGKTIFLNTGKDYEPIGGEMKLSDIASRDAKYKENTLKINDQPVTLISYEIGGYNYFKLRDLGEALDFGVDFDAATRTVLLKAEKSSTDNPTEDQAVEDKPTENKPIKDQVVENKPAEDKPTQNQTEESAKPEKEDTPAVSDAEAVLALMNEARAEEGTAALVLDDKLCQAAEIRAKELAELFSHDRPDGSKCFTVLEDIGWNGGYGALGENIAMGQTTPEIVMNSWMNSSGHRANILNGQFSKVGIARYGNGWVQFFLG